MKVVNLACGLVEPLASRVFTPFSRTPILFDPIK